MRTKIVTGKLTETVWLRGKHGARKEVSAKGTMVERCRLTPQRIRERVRKQDVGGVLLECLVDEERGIIFVRGGVVRVHLRVPLAPKERVSLMEAAKICLAELGILLTEGVLT